MPTKQNVTRCHRCGSKYCVKKVSCIRDKFFTAINATPFSEKGRERLSALGYNLSKPDEIKKLRKTFYKNIYVPPFSTERNEAFKKNSEAAIDEVFMKISKALINEVFKKISNETIVGVFRENLEIEVAEAFKKNSENKEFWKNLENKLTDESNTISEAVRIETFRNVLKTTITEAFNEISKTEVSKTAITGAFNEISKTEISKTAIAGAFWKVSEAEIAEAFNKISEADMAEAFRKISQVVEFKTVFGKDIEHFGMLLKRKDDFENNIQQCTYTIFMLIGTAGSGKTTYLNWLFDTKLNKKFSSQQELIIIDIENSAEVNKEIILCGNDYNFGMEYNSISGRLLSAILYKVNKCLEQTSGEEIRDYKNRLLNICKNYEKFFGTAADKKEIRQLFAAIKDFAQNNEKLQMNALGGALVTVFDEIKDQKNSRDNVDLFFRFFIKVLLCRLSNGIDFDNRSYVIAIDNVESLLDEANKEPIIVQEKELYELVFGIKDSINSIEGALTPKGFHLKNKLSIILSLRDTTVKLALSPHAADDTNYPLNITVWCGCDAQKIYQNKFNTYLTKAEHRTLESDVVYKTFNAIMDDKSESGLYHVIPKMYNYDIRRITEALSQVIRLSLNEQNVFQEYLKWWEHSHRKNVTLAEMSVIRHLCRQAVLRVFYNLFEHQDMFNKLAAGSSLQLQARSSYARKILTYLYQCKESAKYDEQENYVNLHDLVSDLLKPSNTNWGNGINEPELNDLVNILHEMTDIKMLPHFWSPLIVINLNNKAKTADLKNAIYQTVKNESECKESTIKITDAGRAYIYINTNFEYFSSRYNAKENRTPLIFSGNLKKENGEFICIKIIRNVRECTMECIKTLIYNDSQLGSKAAASVCEDARIVKSFFNGMPHPIRILRQHTNYLKDYKYYIEKFANISDKKDEKKISKGISSEIKEYEKFIERILKEDSKNEQRYFSNFYSEVSKWNLASVND